METASEKAMQLYEQGNEFRRRGEWHRAINCYTEAIRMDATSPANEARNMLKSILDYRYKDYYNP